jgi:hypothetical protein
MEGLKAADSKRGLADAPHLKQASRPRTRTARHFGRLEAGEISGVKKIDGGRCVPMAKLRRSFQHEAG